jgi:hypothetical protein
MMHLFVVSILDLFLRRWIAVPQAFRNLHLNLTIWGRCPIAPGFRWAMATVSLSRVGHPSLGPTRKLNDTRTLQVRIPTMPISRSSGSRSIIPIDPDQRGVSAPLDAFLISVFGPNVKHG